MEKDSWDARCAGAVEHVEYDLPVGARDTWEGLDELCLPGRDVWEGRCIPEEGSMVDAVPGTGTYDLLASGNLPVQ